MVVVSFHNLYPQVITSQEASYRSSSIAISRYHFAYLRTHQPLSLLEEPRACLQRGEG
jgi:hypothetical protein